MVITRILGGLGNQLFQYALGRALAERNKTELFLDIHGFREYRLHRYSLSNFNIEEKFFSSREKKFFYPENKIVQLVHRFLRKLLPYFLHPVVHEQFFHFDHNILKTLPWIYLWGYWQSEKYFAHIRPILIREMTVKKPQLGMNKEIASKIRASDSIAIHIRRGDYVKNSRTQEVHGSCPLDYYYSGIKLISGRLKTPQFFIFSDDHQWVKENLKIPFPMTFVDHNDASQNYEDLRLMSQCKHQVIANSTFSWWAAWLNQNDEKIVTAPKKWFQTDQFNTKDLYPPDWIKIGW